MDRKQQLIEQNLNIFLENYIADLLQHYAKTNEDFAQLLAQKKEFFAQLPQSNALLDYDDLQNALLHTAATLFYQCGFDDAIALHKKLK